MLFAPHQAFALYEALAARMANTAEKRHTYPYEYDGEVYQGRFYVQSELLHKLNNPEKFKEMFEHFEQFVEESLHIDWIFKVDLDDSYLTWAMQYKHWGITSYLIERKINLDYRNRYGQTGVMYAAYCGNVTVVEQLVSANANIMLKNNNDETALDMARRGKEENRNCPEGNYDETISFLENEMEKICS